MKLLNAFRRTDDPPSLTGKIVVVHCRMGQGGGVLENARIVRVGFHNFVVGEQVADKAFQKERWSNVTGWFGVSDVSQMNVFDDVEAAKRAYNLDGAVQEEGKAENIDGPKSDQELL